MVDRYKAPHFKPDILRFVKNINGNVIFYYLNNQRRFENNTLKFIYGSLLSIQVCLSLFAHMNIFIKMMH